MIRIKKISFVMAIMIVLSASVRPASAEETATPEEVVKKVEEAARFLSEKGEEGLKALMDPNGPWVWKDTYVWVLHCKTGTNAAHAIKPQLVGMNLMGIRDTDGKLFFAEFCKTAEQPNGGWVEYMWPKVGERTPSRKITYVLQIPGTEYQVAAGIYDETAQRSELEALIE